MKKTTVLLLLMTAAALAAAQERPQNLKNSIDGSLLNQGLKGINAIKLRNTLHLMTDSIRLKTSKFDIGLFNVDNTSDINKPISSATQIELNLKENTLTKGNITSSDITVTGGTGSIIGSGVGLSVGATGRQRIFYGTADVTDGTSVGSNLGDLYINTTSRAVYEKSSLSFPSGLSYIVIPSGTWVKLGNFSVTKADVGLANVDNTSDVDKPVSNATQTALNLKENTLTKGNITSSDITVTGGTGSIIGSGVGLSVGATGRQRIFYGTADVTDGTSVGSNLGDLYINTTSRAVYEKSSLSFPSGLSYIVIPSGTWVKLGNFSVTKADVGLANVDNISDVDKPISTATQAALDIKAGLTANNLFTGANTFFSPIFANSTASNSYSKLTGVWSGTGNIATFSLGYETRFGSNTITRTPLNFDYNGWIGIGITSPTVALDVSGSIKSTSNIQALGLTSTSTTYLATGIGNVGIGTTSPTTKLHIIGNSAIENSSGANLTLYNSSDSGRDGYISITGNGDFSNRFVNIGSSSTAYGFKVLNGAGTHMTILNTGNVGIGTSSPNQKLEVANAGEVSIRLNNTLANFWDIRNTAPSGELSFARAGNTHLNIGNTGNVGIGVTGSDATFRVLTAGSGAGLRIGYLGGSENYYDANFHFFRDGSGFTKFSVIPSGNVGINTGSPTAQLNIVSPAGATDGQGLRLTNSVSTRAWELKSGIQGISNDVFSIKDINAGFTRLSITNGGNVGIGVDVASEKLEVSGSGVVSSRITSTNNTAQLITSGTVGQLYNLTGDLYLTNASTTGAMRMVTNGVERMTVRPNGNVTVGYSYDTGYKFGVNGSIVLGGNVDITGGLLSLYNNNPLAFFNSTGSKNVSMRRQLTGEGDANGIAHFGFDGTTYSLGVVEKDNGNVGIGTHSPAVKLDVVGRIGIRAADGGFRSEILNENSSSPTAQAFSFLNASNQNLLSLNYNGNVGIGTTLPNAPLQFANTTANRKIVLYEGTNNDHDYYGFGINSGALRYQSVNNHIFYGYQSTTTSNQLFSINGNGTVQYRLLTTTEINAIASPVEGMQAWNTTLKLMCTYNGTNWKRPDGTTNM